MIRSLLITLAFFAVGLSLKSQTTYFIDQPGSTDTVGVLYDQGGAAGPYSANANAFFTITPNNGKEVNVQFRDFDVEPGETSVLPPEFRLCEYDNLTVFDGADTLGTNLGTFCGSDLPPNITSTTGSLTFQLKSDGGTEGRGFDIYWTTGELPVLPPPPATAYCSATGFDCDTINGPFDETDIISEVNLTNVSNSSICSANGYADYSHMIAVIPAGSQAQLSVNIDGPGGIPGGVYAWLDMNQDSVFSDDEEIIMVGDVGVEFFTDEPFIGIINAPAEELGSMRLRIRVNGNQAPCGSGDGEVEDYTVFIGDTIVGGGSGYCDVSAPTDCMVGTSDGTTTTFSEDYINSVTLSNDGADIVNVTMCDGGYGDYSDIIAPVTAAGNYSIRFSRLSPSINFMAGAWIDWNNNKIFEETESLVVINDQLNAEYLVNYAVPPTQANGTYRLRVRLTNNALAEPCGFANYEAEDYTILVGAPLECVSNPLPSDGQTDICVTNNTIVWDSVANATNYRFTLIYNDGAGDVIVTQDQVLSDTTYTAPSNFVANATYKWIAVPYNESLEAFGCDTLSFSTTTNGNPIVDIVETNIQICAGNTYSIQANVTDGNAPISFVWTDANAQLDRTDSAVVVFQDNTPGVYKFYVSVSDDLGCVGNADSVTVEVNSGAVAGDFTIADTNACFGEALIVNWINQFGADTIQVSSDNISFADADSVVENGDDFSVFLDPGVYFLRGRLDAGSGCTDVTASIEVVVNAELAMPVVDYVAGSEACQGDEVFILVNNYPDNITWNGDATVTDNPLGVSKSSVNVATYTDPITGCSASSDPISVTINVTPPKPVLVCDGIALGTDMAVSTYEWYKNGILQPQFVGSVIEYDKDESFYNAIAVSDKGCKSELSDTVFMPSPATITYDDINLTADAIGSYYRWYLDGSELIGETAQTLVHNKVEGTYIVEVFNDQDCASAISDEFVLSTVGVSVHFTADKVSVYPNPSTGTVNVFVANAFNEQVTINIVDLSGKNVFISGLDAKQINSTLSVSNLEAGMYIVNVNSSSETVQVKLMVK